MKLIKFNTPDGQYTLPLIKVAEHRADYYFNKELQLQKWELQVNYAMGDNFEGIDWLVNNSNFEDWEDEVIKINSDVNVTMDDFWTDSDDFEIITVIESNF